jgi:hypothetical protein
MFSSSLQLLVTMLPYQGRLWYNLRCHSRSLSRYTSHQSQKVMIEYHLNPLMSCACPSWIEQVDALHLHFSNVSYRTKQIEHLVQNLQGVPKPLWCFHKASKGLGSQWPTLSLNLSNSCTGKNWIGQHCCLPTGRPPCCGNLLDPSTLKRTHIHMNPINLHGDGLLSLYSA